MTGATHSHETPLRVGLLCHSGVGGSARVAAELARQLARRGHDVHLIARATPAMLDRGAGEVAVHTLQATHELRPQLDVQWSADDRAALVELAAEVSRAHRLDVLHFHYGVPFAQVADAVRERIGAGAPAVVGTLHGTDLTWAARAGLTNVLDGLDALTTVSHHHAARALRELRLARAPLVIPNTIDASRFRFEPGTTASHRPARILHISNFRTVKDPVRVARAFAAVRAARDAQLWLVGDGDEMPRVRAELHDAGVERDTVQLGLRTDVEAIYPQCDVVVLTSLQESFSLVALEAAACGLPVVAPRIGGLPELVVDGATGLLYDLDDPAEPARSLLALLDDPARRAAMGGAAQWRAHAYSHERGVPRYEQLYRAVVADHERESAPASEARAAP